MNAINKPIFPTTAATDKIINRLVEVSNKEVIDLDTSFDWKRGADRSLMPKPARNCWIYGTPYYDQLTEEQRRELSWCEISRDVSMFIFLEQRIPPLYVGYINQYRDEIPQHIYEYLMIFSREEIVHTLAFRRYAEMAGLKLFPPPAGYAQLFDSLPSRHPIIGILYTLIIEWAAEVGAMHNVKSDGIDPLTKQLFTLHHKDEVRHISFGRRLIDDFFDTAPEEVLNEIRATVGAHLPNLFSLYTYNPQIADLVSYKFPVAPDDEAAIALIRASDHNKVINNERFDELYAWLEKLKIWERPK